MSIVPRHSLIVLGATGAIGGAVVDAVLADPDRGERMGFSGDKIPGAGQ